MKPDISSRLLAYLTLVALAAGSGCSFTQHGAWVEARRAYDDCLAAHDGDVEACKVERDEANRRYSEYEREAKRAWGCEHSDDCEVGRDRALD